MITQRGECLHTNNKNARERERETRMISYTYIGRRGRHGKEKMRYRPL
jgi:hypothetical protein